MNITIQKDELEQRLSQAVKFVSTKTPTTQTIQGCFISIKNNGSFVLTTNLNDFFKAGIGPKIKEGGDAVFDIKKAIEFTSFLNPNEVNIYTEENSLVIEQGKTKGYFNTFPKEEFPQIPQTGGKDYPLTKKQLEAVGRVIYSASKDETRPILTGIYFSNKNGKSHIVTTDGFRLSLLEEEELKDLPQITIPAGIVNEVIKLATKDSKIKLKISDKEKLITFTLNNFTICSRVLDGDFPPFEKVVPKTSTTQLLLNKQEFIKNLRLVSVFAREQSDVVILDVQKKGFYLRPKFHEAKKTEIFQEPDEFKGEELKIAFNYKYILEFLNNTTPEKVVLEFTQSTAPGLFKGEKDPNLIHIIMPLRTDETTSD